MASEKSHEKEAEFEALKPGDLVKLRWSLHSVPMLSWKPGIEAEIDETEDSLRVVGRFSRGDLGILLETSEEGAKLVSPRGEVGWLSKKLLANVSWSQF